MPENWRKEFDDLLKSFKGDEKEAPKADGKSAPAGEKKQKPPLKAKAQVPEAKAEDKTPQKESTESWPEAAAHKGEEQTTKPKKDTATRRITVVPSIPAPEPPEDKFGETTDIVTPHDLAELATISVKPGEGQDSKATTTFTRAVEDMFQDLVNQMGQVRAISKRKIEAAQEENEESQEQAKAERKKDEELFYRAVERMFENIRVSAMARVNAVKEAEQKALAELQETQKNLKQREEKLKTLQAEIETHKTRIKTLEAELVALSESLKQRPAAVSPSAETTVIDDTYVQELTRRLTETYNILAALEEAYLESEGEYRSAV
jgi:hypothetical protein